MAQCARPAGMGRKGGSVSRCRLGGAVLILLLLAMRVCVMCVMCAMEKDCRLKGWCLLFY